LPLTVSRRPSTVFLRQSDAASHIFRPTSIPDRDQRLHPGFARARNHRFAILRELWPIQVAM
jgi:hypothetical protein